MRGTLALLLRSIRADALSRRANGFRVASVLLILLLLLSSHRATAVAGAPGIIFFTYVSYLMAGLITLAGMGHFANVITEEKEEGTLGLLLMADISPLSILLGKSTNRILSALLVFAAQLPFALLALTLGGISVRQVLCTYVALSAYLFLLANLALLVSVVSRRTGEALAAMAVLMLLMHGAPPYLSLMTKSLVTSGRLSADSWLVSTSNMLNAVHHSGSVFLEIDRILEENARPLPGLQLVLSLVFGSAAFLVAWLAFRRVVWAPDMSAPPRPLATRRRVRRQVFVFRPWSAPLIWKDYYFLAGGALAVIGKLITYPLLFAVSWWGRDWIEAVTDLGLLQFSLHCLVIIAAVEMLVYSSQLFHLEEKCGTLPTLLMLPRSVGYIGYSKVAGCLLASLPTWGAFACIYLADRTGPSLLEWLNRPQEVAVLCAFLLLCQLTVLCSLIVKWGALPLAAALLLILGTVAAPFITAAMTVVSHSYQEAYVQNGPIVYATCIASAAFQLEIGRRIRLAASA